ncbi:MAG: hypothetical protein ACREYE_27835 [Gammaproteobacteria bacterium]
MRIEAELAKFDGKDTAVLRQIAERYTPDAATVRKLLSLTKGNSVALQTGATKLLKWWCERGLRFTKGQSSELVGLLRKNIPWESRLHVLQLLLAIDIAKNQKESLYRILMGNLTHTNKFVRAWAYNGLAVLATQFPEYKTEANQVLEVGMRDEVAAVKARIRNVMKASNTTLQPTPQTARRG